MHVKEHWFIRLVMVALVTPAAAECKLSKIAELPVTMSEMRPVVTAKINGEDASFIADSGAFFSMITPANAAQYHLRTAPAPYTLSVHGIGGYADIALTTVKVFTFAGVPLHNIQFLVGGGEVGSGSVGVIGQNVFSIGDVEYDLARGAIRLIHADGCRKASLAYWASGTDLSYSIMDIDWTSPTSPHTTGIAYVNGAKIRVMFDTGAANSVLGRSAAERAGIKIGAPGVVEAGYTRGIGRAVVKTWVAQFANFKIGNEEIRNTRLRIGDSVIADADMLIGADFFLSHHIYVASSQRKLYFTYNGGPVFNLAHTSTQTTTESPTGAPGDPVDAAGFGRRGAAYAARRDFEHALADLSRATELAPDAPDYRYERALIYLEHQQPLLAMNDLSRAIELKPDDVPALVARAELRLQGKDATGALEDLDSADRSAAREADVRLRLGRDYARADRFQEAIAQLDQWVVAHPGDARLGDALGERCWARAAWGQDLARGLGDCNAALKALPKASPASARVLAGRGVVRMRQGDLKKSIADFDDALTLQPKNVLALYGRGLDELRQGKTTEAHTDMEAAGAMHPGVADDFKRHGMTP